MTYYIIHSPDTDIVEVDSFSTLDEAKHAYVEDECDISGGILATSVDTAAPAQFTVRLNKMVGCYKPNTRLSVNKTISLPFVPVMHMILTEYNFMVDRISWSSGMFHCGCDTVSPRMNTLAELDTLIEDMKRDGWELP